MNQYEEIAKVAHELYEQSGRIPGRDLDNWLEAESIVAARHKSQQKKRKEPSAAGKKESVSSRKSKK